MLRGYVSALVILIVLVAGFSAGPAYGQIARVVVDGRVVNFDQPPIVTGGRVLVPLRGVFEQLGASVEWNPATNVITALRGTTRVQLVIGSRQASVNGQPVTLDAPPLVVGGRTLVPLRFVSEAMGARVDYDYATGTVSVYSPAAGGPVVSMPPVPAPPPPAAPTVVEGIVQRVEGGVIPQRIVVRRDTQVYIFEIASDTTITSADVATSRTAAITLDEIQAGDVVRVTADAAGRAILIRVSVREITGRIEAINARSIVLSDGRAYALDDDVRVFVGGRQVRRDQLAVGMDVTLRLHPQTNRVIALAAQPLQTQPPATGTVEIASFSHDARGPLRVGAVITATLRGTPGGDASFDIFGLASGVPMDEVSPGLYRGTYRVRPQDSVAHAVVVAHLRVRGQDAPPTQASAPIVVDTAPPQIVQRYPNAGQAVNNTRPNIVVHFNDPGGSGIDPAKTRLIVNNRDVTAQASMTQTSIAYNPPQSLSGQVEVSVVLADQAGNTTRDRYSFVIGTLQGALIRSVTINPALVRPGEQLSVTVVGDPGGQAAFRVDGITGNIPMTEVAGQPGVYVGSYIVSSQNSVQNARVVVSLTRGRQRAEAEASARLTVLGSAQVPAPVIRTPAPGARVTSPITVRGTATPGHQVVVRVDYQGSLLLFRLGGTYGEVETIADAAGNWAVMFNQTLRVNAELTITAVAVDPMGRRSESAVAQVFIR
jgi:hypothetical protein